MLNDAGNGTVIAWIIMGAEAVGIAFGTFYVEEVGEGPQQLSHI